MTFPITDESRIALFPLRLSPFGDGKFSILRKGRLKRVSTGLHGAEAIGLLRTGKTVGEVRAELARRHGFEAEQVNLEPLFKALLGAHMIRKVDGRSAAPSRFDPREWFRFHVRTGFWPRLRRLGTQCLPARCRKWVLRSICLAGNRASFHRQARQAAENFARCRPALGYVERRRFRREYLFHILENVVEVENLRQKPFAEVEAWIDDHMSLVGFEHLDRAIARGRGVMLFGFHFTANRLLPVVLMRKGYSLLSMGAINLRWGSQRTKALLEEWSEARPSHGRVSLVDNLDMASVSALIRQLRAGGIVLTAPDVYSASVHEDPAMEEKTRFFGIVRPVFPRATTTVPFFEGSIEANPWAGWLAKWTRPEVVPIMITREGGRMQCRVSEALRIDARAECDPDEYAAQVNKEIYRFLEAQLKIQPAQWFGWANLHKLQARTSDGGSTSDAVPRASRTRAERA
jgi:lauroyl/myristoyl acyltransferase